MGDIALPQPLLRLAALLGQALGGPPATAIDEAVIALALRRHYVGPLLYAAVSGGAPSMPPELFGALNESYRLNAARQAAALVRLRQIATEFAARNIDWMALKGVTQAAQLYAEPGWRDSADIDILVPPRDFSAALDALTDLGFVARYPPMPASRALRGLVLGLIRDVTLIARNDHTCAVDLHRRLFFVSGRRAESLHLDSAPATVPSPAAGPDLALYLIVHGALCWWVRLKWLADLVPLLAKLDDAEKLALLESAKRVDVENSVAASLLLLRALFPFVALGPLSPWLEGRQPLPAVTRRLRCYVQTLALDQDQGQSPLNNGFSALKANWMVFEAPSTRLRLLLSAGPSSLARRLARVLFRSDGAPTLPDMPL